MNNYKFYGKYSDDYITEMRNILNLCNNFNKKLYSEDNKYLYNNENPDDSSSLVGEFIYDIKKYTVPIIEKYEQLESSLMSVYNDKDSYIVQLNNQSLDLSDVTEQLRDYRTDLLDKVNYYVKVGKACGKILVLIYFCLLCTIATFGCVLLILYSLLQKQRPLDILMHIIWNSIRFFVFSFFIYGAVFGMLYLGLRDLIKYNMFLFGEQNLNSDSVVKFPLNETKEYLKYCLISNNSISINKFRSKTYRWFKWII